MDTNLVLDIDLFPGDLSNFAAGAMGLDGSEGTIQGASLDVSNIDSVAVGMYVTELTNMKNLMQNYYDLFMEECNLINEMYEAILKYDSEASEKIG